MSSSNFSVGSVVYFLHNKTERVLPAQVMERIDRTTIDGSKSTYVISVPSSGGELKSIEVDPDKVSIFQTPDEMKKFMIERATIAITGLCETALSAASIFGHFVDPELESISEQTNQVDESQETWHVPAAERPLKKKAKKGSSENYAEVDLGNGRSARLKMGGSE